MTYEDAREHTASLLRHMTPKLGRWIETNTNEYTCSRCSRCFTIVPEDNHISQFKYCPNCRAKMEA